MSKALTISLSDEAYASLEAASVQAHQPLEEMVVALIAERFGENGAPRTLPQHVVDPVIAVMCERGHLVDDIAPTASEGVSLPPLGSAERAQFEENLARELGEAFQQSGGSILDLIERR